MKHLLTSHYRKIQITQVLAIPSVRLPSPHPLIISHSFCFRKLEMGQPIINNKRTPITSVLVNNQNMSGYLQNLPSLKDLGSTRVTLKHNNIINRQGVSKRKTNSPIVRLHLKTREDKAQRMSYKYMTPFLTLFPKQMSLALSVILICSNSVSSTPCSRCFRTFRSRLKLFLLFYHFFILCENFCMKIVRVGHSLKYLDLMQGILQILKQCFHCSEGIGFFSIA